MVISNNDMTEKQVAEPRKSSIINLETYLTAIRFLCVFLAYAIKVIGLCMNTMFQHL